MAAPSPVAVSRPLDPPSCRGLPVIAAGIGRRLSVATSSAIQAMTMPPVYMSSARDIAVLINHLGEAPDMRPRLNRSTRPG